MKPAASEGHRTTEYYIGGSVSYGKSIGQGQPTVMLKWPIADEGFKSFGSLISPSRCRVYARAYGLLDVCGNGQQTADATSSNDSIQATSGLAEEVA